jgi:DoxX-like family
VGSGANRVCNREFEKHPGYPPYFLNILVSWQFFCALVLLLPRFPLLKEWAYAGAFFNYSSAIASHLFVGDGPNHYIPPLVFALFTVASWALRPLDRRVARSTPVGKTRALSWIVPIIILIVLLVLSLLTLPNGPTL